MSNARRLASLEAGRVLHVVEAREDDAAPTVALIADLARALSVDADVAIVGPSSAASMATAAGCRVVGRYCPPLREPRLAPRSLRRMVERVAGDRPLMVWGSTACAAIVAGLDRPMRWCATGPVEAVSARLAAELREVETVTLSADHAAEVAAVAPGALIEAIEPWVGDRQAFAERREVLRDRWGADEGMLMVGVIGPVTTWTDFRRAADIVGIAAARGVRVTLVGHPDAARAERTEGWMREIGLPWLPLTVDHAMAEPWRVAAGLDAAIVLGDGVATAGADAAGRRGRWFTDRALRPQRAPTFAALWLAAAGVPLLIEQGAIDPTLVGVEPVGTGTSTVFRRSDPLQATRSLLVWSAPTGAAGVAGEAGIDGAARRREAGDRGRSVARSTALPRAWRRVLCEGWEAPVAAAAIAR